VNRRDAETQRGAKKKKVKKEKVKKEEKRAKTFRKP